MIWFHIWHVIFDDIFKNILKLYRLIMTYWWIQVYTYIQKIGENGDDMHLSGDEWIQLSMNRRREGRLAGILPARPQHAM